ncbi:MAG: undecaprenyl-diphosphatase [Gammaproteobacteria bacterium]|nr:undecaprenyl-diphosphatase [Gammaproteobacteria bacterium]
MIDYIQIASLSIIQGITEFLPISSTAHSILFSKFMDWEDQTLFLDICMHLGSLLAVILFLMINFKSSLKNEFSITKNSSSIHKIVIATIPLIFFGGFFYNEISTHMRTFEVITITTILFAIIIIALEYIVKKNREITSVSYSDAIVIGLFQSLALIPGTSRAAVTIMAALILGFNKTTSVLISFILSVPAIFCAITYQTFRLDYSNIKNDQIFIIFIAIVLSFITSYIVINFFLKFINIIGLLPFMIYRIFLGTLLIIFIL